MNITERGIREQFPFWTRAGASAFLADPALTYGVVGCGTSVYIADTVAAALCRRGIDARAVPGGEWISRRHDYLPHDRGLHMLALSRSGESTETVQAAAVSQAAGIPVTAITCAAGSSLTGYADRVLMAETHPDEGIVMTASASLMLLMGLRFAGIEVRHSVAARAEQLMMNLDSALSPGLLDRAQFVFLGGGGLYGIACEGALKLQEMSLSHTSAYHPLEYRHGPVSLVDEGTLVVVLYHPDTATEEAVLARELQAKGACVIGLGGPGDLSFPITDDIATRGLVCLPALQLLGERTALARGRNSEAPRHLTKVVLTS